MSHSRLVVIVALGLLAGVLIVPAEGSEATLCIARAEQMRISPGFSSTASAGMVVTELDGIEQCFGPMDGHHPTGPVRTHHVMKYGWRDPDTCTSMEFKGYADHAIPTAKGVVVIRNHFTGNLDPAKQGIMSASFQGTKFSGRFGAQPLEGDCVTSPLTLIEVFFQGIWHGSQG